MEKDVKPKIIPVPPVKLVPTYNVDYLPVHRIDVTFLKAPRDPKEVWEADWQEYDLDVQDTVFLNDVNQGGTQDRLSARQLEVMLWTLEVRCAAATERSLQAAGAPSAPPPVCVFRR